MKNKRKSGIYCIENIINNKKYIGQSIDINDRWRRHVNELEHNCHHNDYLQKSWNKNGKNNFDFYVLEYCDVDSLDDKERYYISLYNTMDRNLGYNLISGGQDNHCMCEASKKKLSDSIKSSYINNHELIERRRIDAINYWSNPENVKKHSGKNNGMFGKKHSEESKKLMSENRKGTQSWNRNHKKVMCLELNKIYEDSTSAGESLNISGYNILKVCRGQRKTCGGYHWSFVEN